jgi:hypothetical protein
MMLAVSECRSKTPPRRTAFPDGGKETGGRGLHRGSAPRRFRLDLALRIHAETSLQTSLRCVRPAMPRGQHSVLGSSPSVIADQDPLVPLFHHDIGPAASTRGQRRSSSTRATMGLFTILLQGASIICYVMRDGVIVKVVIAAGSDGAGPFARPVSARSREDSPGRDDLPHIDC